MTIAEALARVKEVRVVGEGPLVLHTVVAELARVSGGEVTSGDGSAAEERGEGVFLVHSLPDMLPTVAVSVHDDGVYFALQADGSGHLAATHYRFLFSFVTHLLRDLADNSIEAVSEGRFFKAAFSWNRPTYDYFLTQEGRIQKDLDRESYVRRLAESGFTHVEVNGLAAPSGYESGPVGEAYPMFYTYCPALDQFVSSSLNAGLYPEDG